MSKDLDEYHANMACLIARLKCNKDRELIKHEIQICQNELMRIKPRLTVFDYGKYLTQAIKFWKDAYSFNQAALGKFSVQLEEVG